MKNAVIKNLYESMSMLHESYEYWTEEDWAKKLKKVCHLNKEEADDLLHDLNNLRGNEWLEIVEDNCDDEELLIAFKEFIGVNDIWEDEFDESLNEQIWSSYPGDNYLNNKKNIIDSVNKFITKYNLNDVSIDNIVYRPDLDTALINIVFTPQIREYAPSIIDDFCKDIVKERRNKSKEKLLYRKYIHDSDTFLPAIELVRSFDESLKEDYNSDLEIERKVQKYLDDHNLWGEVSVQDGTVYVEIHWGDWKHDHWYCQDLMSELGYVLVDKEVTEEDGSDTFSAIHTYEKMDVTNESLSLKKSINESPEAKDIAPDVLDYREKMQNAMKTRVREWGVNSITHFGHAVDNTHNELLELEQDGLFSKEAFNKTYALKCISSIINYVENDVLSKLYEYKSYIENK